MSAQTGFEQRDLDGAWTSFEEEAVYLDAIVAELGNVTREVVGTGYAGDDIVLYKVGSGSRHVFLMAQMHGDEVAPRDALLSLIRDWAQDPTLEDYLQQFTLLVIPTMRPDSMTTRNPPNDVSINIDNFDMINGETQAIQRVWTQYQPELGVDGHEARNMDQDMATHPIKNLSVHPDLYDLSAELEGHVRGDIEGGGWTWEPYWQHSLTTGQNTTNYFGLRHMVGILLESRRGGTSNNLDNVNRRYQVQYTSLRAVIDWHRENHGRVLEAYQASRQRASQEMEMFRVITRNGATDQFLSPAPTEYRISSGSLDDYQWHQEILGLPTPDNDGTVSTLGDTAYVMHYIMNPISTRQQVQVEEPGGFISGRTTTPTRPTTFIRSGGVTVPVSILSAIPPDESGGDPEAPPDYGMVRRIDGPPVDGMSDPLVFDTSEGTLYEHADGAWSLSDRFRLDENGDLYERTG